MTACPNCGDQARSGQKFCGRCGSALSATCPSCGALEYAEWLIERGREDEAEPLLAAAREVFERLEARPWLDRAASAAGALA